MTTAATDLRLVYGPNAAKKIARKFGVAVVTAKLWLAGRTPAARHEQIRQALLAQADELDAMVADIRRRWEQEATDETDSSATRRVGAAPGSRVAVARGEADRDGPLVR